MLIYLITILFLFALSALETFFKMNRISRSILFAAAFLMIVLQVGLRWETGTDWPAYYNHFKALDVFLSDRHLINLYEIGYKTMVWIIRLFTDQYFVFLLAHAAIYYYLVMTSLEKYTPYLFLSLLLFYTSTMGMLGANRMLIALAICLFSLRFAKERKPVKFFVLIFIAMNFHLTSVLFAIYYFLNRDIKAVSLILILSLCFLLGNIQFPVWLFSFFGNLFGPLAAAKVNIYLQETKSFSFTHDLPVTGLIKRIVFLFLFYYNRKILIAKVPYYNLMLNGYIVGIGIYFLFAGSLLIMISRGSLLFNVMEPFLLSCQLLILKNDANKLIGLFLILALSVILFFQSIESYPELFIPYKSIIGN